MDVSRFYASHRLECSDITVTASQRQEDILNDCEMEVMSGERSGGSTGGYQLETTYCVALDP